MKSVIFSMFFIFANVPVSSGQDREVSKEIIYKNLVEPVTLGSNYCRIVSTDRHTGMVSVETIIIDPNKAGLIYLDDGNFLESGFNISRRIIKLSKVDVTFWSGDMGLHKMIKTLSDFKQKEEPSSLTIEAKCNGVFAAKRFGIMDISMYPDPINRLMKLIRAIRIPDEK